MSSLLQPIEQIVSPEILSCTCDTTVRQAAALMAERRCGSIVVFDEANHPVGIWTESDLLRIDFSDSSLADAPISKVMSYPVLTLDAGMTVHDATSFFRRRKIRHALVERNGHVFGILSASDIVINQGYEAFLGLKRVESLPLAAPMIVAEEASLAEVVSGMQVHGTDTAVTCAKDGTLGILTLRDVLYHLADGKDNQPVGAVCSRPLRTISPLTSLLHARKVMMEHGIRHLAVLDEGGKVQAVLGFTDILASIEHEFLHELHAALKERDDALLQSRQSLLLADKVFEATLEGILITDKDGVIRSVNPAFTRITGFSAAEAVGKTPSILNSGKQSPEFYQHLWNSLKRDGSWQGEVINRRKNGLLYTEHLSITGIRDEAGVSEHYVAVFSDITQRKLAEERLHYLANHDALTGLPNRTLFLERLQRAVERAEEDGSHFALFFVDLDRFKLVNDTLGHQAGDELLMRIATDLRGAMPAHATVARLSGDEFTILMENVVSIDQVASRAQALLQEVAEESEVHGEEVFISASIGISLYPEDGRTADILLANADAAMYRAKERGKNTFQFYTADMNARATERLKLEYALHRALVQKEFALWYQPKVELATGRLYGAEALLRWRHPELGMVSPAVFIPVAEESSLMASIGEWVLATACSDVRRWSDAGLFQGRIAVNLSGRQFKFGNIVTLVQSVLAESGLPSNRLELEVTESVAMDAEQGMVQMLKELRDLGVELAIDDFGTGYSSLAYLKRLPVQVLKVDQSFVAGLPGDSDDAAITTAIVSIAKSLGLKVVAEGIETDEQRAFLLTQGCDFGQGYLFSKPLPAEVFEQFMLERVSQPALM